MKILTALISVVVFVCSSANEVPEDPLVVHTQLGWVRGQHYTSRGGRQIVEFLGIHYAKAPTGSLRFKSPVCSDRWAGVFNATKECSDCVQQYVLLESTRNVVTGAEDCLCLNVFTPNVSTTANLPVIVWLHGGGYAGGSGAKLLYGPEFFLDHDVILVTLNYRLGLMGFLSTADSVIPGNFGMKDQALALRWVKNNIASFGGNSDDITLFGESAGAVSVSLHQRSPLSQGLFQKAIQHSGGYSSPWGMTSPDILKGRTASAAEMLGCPSTDSEALLICMQTLPAETIVNTTHRFLIWDLTPIASWTPTIEDASVEDAFLTEDPRISTKASTVPLLTGFNNAEGGFLVTLIGGKDAKANLARWNKEFNTLTPKALVYNNTYLDKPTVTTALKKFYFGSEKAEITTSLLKQMVELFGDSQISMSVLDEVETHGGPTFLYYYNYNKTFSMCPLLLIGAAEPVPGACHFDDLTNFFPLQGFGAKYNTSDPAYLTSAKLVEMWTNFVKNTNPSTSDFTWTPAKKGSLNYLDISNAGLSMKTNPIQKRREFWQKLRASAQRGDSVPQSSKSESKGNQQQQIQPAENENSSEEKETGRLLKNVVKGVGKTVKKTVGWLL